MAFKTLRMDKKELIYKYNSLGYSIKKITRLTGISRNTIKKYIRHRKGLEIPDTTSSLDSVSLENKLASKNENNENNEIDLETKRDLDFQSQAAYYIDELKRVGVTRHLLWREYKIKNKDAYSYSRFCRKIKSYKKSLAVTLKLEHKAAYRLSVDYTGKKIEWIDKKTGQVLKAEVLVCTMPYSAYTFACAVRSQKQEDFVQAINNALIYMGGLPEVIQSDNLKSFVIKADRYEPTFNDLCIQMSSYYGVEIEATRVGKPKDKASVERHVNIIYNKIYGPLRNEIFTSIKQINQAFLPLLNKLNQECLQGKDYSRQDRFLQDEKPHMGALPNKMFDVEKSTKAKVQMNYHVILGEDKHQYSVPYQYVGKSAIIVYTGTYVQVYCGSERIAVHKRDRRKNAYSTLAAHMPEKHLRFLERKGWDATYFKREARKIGDNTLWAMEELLKSKSLIEQTYNSCLGVLSLSKKYGSQRLDKACEMTRDRHRVNYGILRNILNNNMDKIKQQDNLFSIPKHDNIRGADSYQ